MTVHASMKAKSVGKDGEAVHIEKSSNDSVELAGVCKL